MLVVTAIAVIALKDLFAVAMLVGIYSFLIAGVFMDLGAVDVAFTEAAVGAGVTTVLLLASLRLTGRYERRGTPVSWPALFVVVVTGMALLYGTLDAPLLGDPQAPAHQHVAPRYIQQAATEVGVPNMVTAVLASYRGYDTLGETLVIFTAGLAVLLMLGTDKQPSPRPGRNSHSHHLVLRVVSKFLIPYILLFGLYVQFHGDYGAGGGFQAGVIFATGFVLYDLVFGRSDSRQVVPAPALRCGAAVGVLLFAAVGVTGMLGGKAFLDYSVLAAAPLAGQHLGILLVELGVGLTVFSVVLSLFYALSGRSVAP